MHSCEHCQSLWRTYGVATKIHVELDNKLRFAALQSDLDEIEALTRQTEAAERVRLELRRSIRKHEGSHENGLAEAAYQ